MSKLMGFECVVRGLRLDRFIRRPSWPSNECIAIIGSTVRKCTKGPNGLVYSEYFASSDDILANDWEIASFDPVYTRG